MPVFVSTRRRWELEMARKRAIRRDNQDKSRENSKHDLTFEEIVQE